jgi:NCS1 family nucleobase:cation symporter-1
MNEKQDQDRESLGLAVERHSIDPVPADQRHGTVTSLFTVWFGANMHMTPVVTGALGTILGLKLPWAILALVLGNLFGAVFMALHSAQGPKLGIPQMIQSRAQFGVHGAILPLTLVVLMYIGFFASSTVLGGAALVDWLGIAFVPATVLLSALITVLSIYGYWAIHRLERIFSVIALVAFLFLTWRLFVRHDVGAAWHAGPVPSGLFLLVLSIAATWQITYAPYVADYSRYLPQTTSIRAAFWWTYGGSALATVWMMAMGAVAAALGGNTFHGGSSQFVVDLAPGPVRPVISGVLVLGVVAANVLNLYGIFMSATTTLTAIRPFKVTRTVRAMMTVVLAIIGTSVAILGQGNFVHNLTNFILFLSYFLIPWTAINLADFTGSAANAMTLRPSSTRTGFMAGSTGGRWRPISRRSPRRSRS